MTPEYARQTFTRATMEDKRERIPNDYGPADSYHYRNAKPMTREEENEYLDLLLTAEEQITF